MTISEFYKNFVDQLNGIYEAKESVNISDWVFESIAGIKRLDRVTQKNRQLEEPVIQRLNHALQQLLQHRPVQYVLGEVWFYKMKLKVNENVLIPRPETEELVEWVGEEIRNKELEIRNKKGEQPSIHDSRFTIPDSSLTTHNSPLTILDIGTGSGCIAIALKKLFPLSDITAIDVSKGALMVARENAADQNAEIGFRQIDFLDRSSWPSLPSFDIIVSNPPYIPAGEKNKLAKNVTGHEPHLALFVDDTDPFVFYRNIALFAETHLNDHGKIFVEVHEDYAKEVQEIFAQYDFHSDVKKDIYGRERMVKAVRKEFYTG